MCGREMTRDELVKEILQRGEEIKELQQKIEVQDDQIHVLNGEVERHLQDKEALIGEAEEMAMTIDNLKDHVNELSNINLRQADTLEDIGFDLSDIINKIQGAKT